MFMQIFVVHICIKKYIIYVFNILRYSFLSSTFMFVMFITRDVFKTRSFQHFKIKEVSQNSVAPRNTAFTPSVYFIVH